MLLLAAAIAQLQPLNAGAVDLHCCPTRQLNKWWESPRWPGWQNPSWKRNRDSKQTPTDYISSNLTRNVDDDLICLLMSLKEGERSAFLLTLPDILAYI